MLTFCFENAFTDIVKNDFSGSGWDQDKLDKLGDRLEDQYDKNIHDLSLNLPDDLKYDFAVGLGRKFNGINGIDFTNPNIHWGDTEELKAWGDFYKNHPEVGSLGTTTVQPYHLFTGRLAKDFNSNIAKPMGINPEDNTMSFWDRLTSRSVVIPNLD